METEFDEHRLRKQLEGLSKWKQLVFMVCCCERMFPNYVIFANETGWGQKELIRRALDTAWTLLLAARSCANCSHLAQKCEDSAPDVDDFVSSYTSAALDAAVSAAILMEAFHDFDQSGPITIATLSRDTVDMHVRDIENIDTARENYKEKVLHHELMQTELRAQREDIEVVKDLAEDDVNALHKLKGDWANRKIGSLGLAP